MTAPQSFGTTPGGDPVLRVTLENGGARAAVMTWGASLIDFRLAGIAHSLVLGAAEFAPYLGPLRYYGAIVGRVANRIAGGHAPLDDALLAFERNEDGRTTLHGGSRGSARRNWRLESQSASACHMTLRLGDGEGGFPGTLDLGATYSLDAQGALEIALEGRTDRPTFCNLAHHGYWTLTGAADLSGHRLQIDADQYLPVDGAKIPLGAPAPVAGTAFDFRRPRALPGPRPLDHNFCLREAGPGPHPACTLDAGGLRLGVSTTAPGLQVYDGAGTGLALEPQHWPDAPNHPDFPSVVLRPGETYRQRARFHARRGPAPIEETT